MRDTKVTLELTHGEIGRISFLLDGEVFNRPHSNYADLQRKWDALYIAVNTLPFGVKSIVKEAA